MTALSQFRPPSVVADDRVLAEALQRGEQDAVRELYDRFGGLVFTVSLHVLGDRRRAEEASLQTFLQAWHHADRFEPGRDFAPWLAIIARRASIDIGRCEAPWPTDALDDARADDGALAHVDPSAEEVDRVWLVRAVIDQLEPTDRELVRLQHLEGLCHAEIVDRLDVAIGTVKWRSFRAHSRLSQKLGHLRDDFDEIGAGVNRGGAGDEEKGGG